MRDLSNLLWCDLQTDRERLEFIQSGRAVHTGILAPVMVEDLVEVYRRIDAALAGTEWCYNPEARDFTPDKVWEWAAKLADAEPKIGDATTEQRRHICERCGGTGVQQAGCWTGKAYDSIAGRCELCAEL